LTVDRDFGGVRKFRFFAKLESFLLTAVLRTTVNGQRSTNNGDRSSAIDPDWFTLKQLHFLPKLP
jgi:hypothetical protein